MIQKISVNPTLKRMQVDNRKIEGPVAALIEDIPRQPSEPKRQLRTQKQKPARRNQHDAQNQQHPPELAHRLHPLPFYTTQASDGRAPRFERANHNSLPAKKYPISNAAVSGASEPCVQLY